MKREGVRTLFIRSYLRALNRYLTFENAFWMCKFENILKMPKFDNFVMILVSVQNTYKVFILKIFQKRSVLCENFFCL